MTETMGVTMILNQSYIEDAPYYPGNETFLVNDFISGIYHDLLLSLQKQLNFTTSVYKRKERSWGFVYPQSNGSFIATGMVGDVYFKRADIIIAALALVHRRALYIDFMVPLSSFKIGLFLPTHFSENQFDFYVYLAPFRLVYFRAEFPNLRLNTADTIFLGLTYGSPSSQQWW